MAKAKLLHTQKLRFIIDVEVCVRDLPQALIDGTVSLSQYEYCQEENPDEFNEFIAFQKRLLHGLLNDPDATLRLLIEKAGNEAADNLSERYASNNAPSDEEILSDVLNNLDSKDKNLIEDFRQNEVFTENTGIALFDAFEVEVIKSTVHSI